MPAKYCAPHSLDRAADPTLSRQPTWRALETRQLCLRAALEAHVTLRRHSVASAGTWIVCCHDMSGIVTLEEFLEVCCLGLCADLE